VTTGQDDTRQSVRNGISNAMARIKREFYGKGPARTRTYICDSVIFSMLDDVLTPVERTLKKGGRDALVRRTRLTFEDIMTRTFTDEVEKLTGATVVAYHSQIVFDPDMAIEIFVLDRPVRASARHAAADVESARLAAPGEVGDAEELPNLPDDRPVLAQTAERPAPAEPGEGQVRAAISNALVRLLADDWGKGPVRAKTYLEDQFVFCVFEDPLTTVEKTLLRGGEAQLVRELRSEFQAVKSMDFAAEVERATGARVLSCHCQVVFDPDILFQIYVLDAADAGA
jgi:uncharacterized protein YbcI